MMQSIQPEDRGAGMAKKTFPVNKTIKTIERNSSKANGAKKEKPSIQTTLKKDPGGKPKGADTSSSGKRVQKVTASLEQQLAQREAELAIINSIQEGLAS